MARERSLRHRINTLPVERRNILRKFLLFHALRKQRCRLPFKNPQEAAPRTTQGTTMSLSIVHSRAQIGVDAPAVTVEVHLANGLPSLTMVGLPEAAVKESKDRVRSAIINSGLQFPARRITLNLAPADLPKDGGY